MPLLPVVAVILFLALAAGAVFAIRLPGALRKRGVIRHFWEGFGRTFPDKLRSVRSFSPPPVDGHRLGVSFRAAGFAEYVKLTIEGGPFLPDPLRINKQAEKYFPEFLKDEDPGIVLADGGVIDRIEGRDERTAALVRSLETLDRGSTALIVRRSVIACLAPLHRSPLGKIKETIDAALRAASLFREIARETDVSLPILALIARSSPDEDERLKSLHSLVALHREAPLTRETLSALAAGPDYDTGIEAARELGIKPLDYCRSRLEKSPPAEAVKAIPVFLERADPETRKYLVEYFRGIKDQSLQSRIILGLHKRPSEAAQSLYRESIGEWAPDLRSLIDAAMGEPGESQSSAAGTDGESASFNREQAEAALKAIKFRISHLSGGGLSLSGDVGEEGELSTADEESGEGGLSKADNNSGEAGGVDSE